ncbi:MAG: hypothetical protein LQ346_003963 [Caloplaca aetnensis]|nr:MAG: hypothetical protein LQ346_003963 [Caloplaca aetnensis]
MSSPAKAPVGYTNGTSFVWNTKGEVIAAAAVLPFLGILLVALRFYSRIKYKSGLGPDDWLIVPAMVIVTGMGVTLLVGVGRGVVAHTTKPNPDTSKNAQLYQTTPEQEFMKKVEFIIYVIMVPAYGFIKLSVIYFYRRIFVKATPDSRFNIVTHVTSIIVVAWTIVFFFLEIFKRGSYVPDNWGPLIKAKQGINGAVLNNGLFVSDFITDLWIVLLPIPLIVRLNMSTTKKLTVIGVLLLGAMSFCAAIVRMVFNVQIVNAGLAKKTDVNMGLTTLMYWSMVEAGLSLIAANLPSVYSFFSQNASLQSTFSSLRSRLSLRSFRSTEKLRGRSRSKPYEHMDGSSSDGSTHKQAFGEKENHDANYIYTGNETDKIPTGGMVSVRSDIESQGFRSEGGRAV